MVSNQQKKPKKKKRPILRAIKIIFLTILALGVLSSVAASGVVLAMIKTAPALDVDEVVQLDQPSVLYDDSGQKMDTVVTKQTRVVVHMDQIPTNMANAFVSIEDERFRQHKGLDVKRVLGVLVLDLKNKIHKQGDVQGASTITQQLIKNRMFLADSLENRLSVKRKVQEMYLSVELEKVLTKDQILEAYMNTIFLGGQANGVEAAANQYFNKSAKDLNLVQCAFIAGLAQSPSKYSPLSSTTASKNHSIYLNRTKTVLYKMHENNYISDKDYEDAITDMDNKLQFNFNMKTNSGYAYQWFSIPAMEQVKQDLEAQYHYTDDQIDSLFSNGGLKVYTTMNRDLQEKAQDILTNNYILKGATSKDKNGIMQPQASAVLMDYHTGQVKVIIGGRGTQPPGSLNRAASNNFLRATGSSIKPISVYTPSIDTKAAAEGTIIDDSPLPNEIASKYVDDKGDPYQPMDDDYYRGPITVKEAITHSVNVVAVKLEDKIGVTTGASYAEKFGLLLDNEDKRSTSIAAMALGQLHKGENPLIMAAAYGVFGNSGQYNSPKLYTKVVDSRGVTILENTLNPKRVISPQTAYIMYDLLKGPVSSAGTGPAANFGDMPVAGKTGTATDAKDLWFCGLTPYYSGAVWIGRDDHKAFADSYKLNSNSAAEIWARLMEYANTGHQTKDIQAPTGLEAIGNDYYLPGTEVTSAPEYNTIGADNNNPSVKNIPIIPSPTPNSSANSVTNNQSSGTTNNTSSTNNNNNTNLNNNGGNNTQNNTGSNTNTSNNNTSSGSNTTNNSTNTTGTTSKNY
ncbi:MAG: PBP1A family penicillin-binding protein [Bacillota bacterium]|nr:PBP1A family penicillin-binding protein [Bacillota bacterium]